MEKMQKSKRGLVGKAVMTKEGLHIGTIKNLSRYGKKEDSILVSPCKDIKDKNFPHTKQGEMIIPLRYIESVKDIVILEE